MQTGVKSSVAKSHTSEGAADLSVPLVFKTEGKHPRTSAESKEDTYDPFWAHVYAFLQDLEANFAVPLSQARFGSLVKFSALIQFLDLKIMRNLWEPAGRIFLQSQNDKKDAAPSTSRQRHRAQQRKQSTHAQPPVADAARIGIDVLKGVPHLLHMTFMSKSDDDVIYNLWSAIQPDYLTIASEDLVMKYGAVMDGLWTVVGIVDARIGPAIQPWKLTPVLDSLATAMAGLREIIGRPEGHWGLTPIAIYAPLQGAAEAEIESPESGAGKTPAAKP